MALFGAQIIFDMSRYSPNSTRYTHFYTSANSTRLQNVGGKKKVADIRPKSFSFFRRHLNRILLEHQEILENAGSQCIATRKGSNTLT